MDTTANAVPVPEQPKKSSSLWSSITGMVKESKDYVVKVTTTTVVPAINKGAVKMFNNIDDAAEWVVKNGMEFAKDYPSIAVLSSPTTFTRVLCYRAIEQLAANKSSDPAAGTVATTVVQQ